MSDWVSIRLCAETQTELLEVLVDAGLAVIDDGLTVPLAVGDHHRLVIRGILYESTGQVLTDGDGSEYSEVAAVAGYHADVIVHPDYVDDLILNLASVVIKPQPVTPIFEWAGIESE